MKNSSLSVLVMAATVALFSSCDSSSNPPKEDAPPPQDTSDVEVVLADTVAAPVFSLSGGAYTGTQTVALSTKTIGAAIFYTTDGTVPTTSSTEYASPVSVGKTATLKAIAAKSGWVTSPVSTVSYTISVADSDWGIPWNKSVAYGTLKDSRDGLVYRTVVIGTQTWMAENLNYRGSGADTVGVCFNNRPDSCSKYGRLYKWLEVMNGSSASSTNPSKVKGICPTGWHVPSDSEWTEMENHVGAPGGTKLKSSKGWHNSGNGTDAYGFRALPAGNHDTHSFYSGMFGSWWTASKDDPMPWVWERDMMYDTALVLRHSLSIGTGYSLRCSQD